MARPALNALLIAALVVAGPSCEERGPDRREIGMTVALPDALAQSGFGELASFLRKVGRPSLRLLEAGESAAQRPGTSRIGGAPDLPKSLTWPCDDRGASLSFIAQIDLTDVTQLANPFALPERGWLYFFYDAEQSVWGFHPADQHKWCVLFASGDQPVQPTSLPEDLPKPARYQPVELRPEVGVSYPDPYDLDLQRYGVAENDEERVFEIFETCQGAAGARHRMFGYADQIQGAMELECQLVSNGLYCGDASGYEDPRAAQLRGGASEWRLLLQVDSEDANGMMWGDLGRLYFWMRESDLRAGRFERAWLILQCH